MPSPSKPMHPEDEDRYGSLVERCGDGILVVRHAFVISANRAAARLTGRRTPEQLKGCALSDILPATLPLDEGPSSISTKLHLPDGSAIDAEISITPYPDAQGQKAYLVVVRDLSTYKHIADTLSRQDRYLRLITDKVPALIAYVDTGQHYRFVNATYASLFERPQSSIVGMTMCELLGRAYQRAHPYIKRALAGETVKYELQLFLPSGERHVMAVYTPDIGADGNMHGFSIMMMDISERKKGEQILRAQEQQLRLITDAVPVLIAQCDRDYRLQFVNKICAERYGYQQSDVLGKRLPDILGEEFFSNLRPYIDAALAGTPQEQEVRYTSADGQAHVLHMMYVPELDEHGKAKGLIAAINDITRLRHAERALERREREFKTLVESSPDIISRIGRDMRHLYVNPAIELLGVKASAYLGKAKAELGLPPAVVRAWDDAARAAFATGLEQKLDFDHEFDGKMRYFSGRVVPETDHDGNIESVVGIAYEVTERARMEKERDELLARERNARIQAEIAARARDEFLAIVSHELRAPLNGIQSWAHVLENYVKDASMTPLAQRALQGIKTGVGQQVRLIEDLLDVTRIMSGKLRLVRQPLPLLPVLRAAVQSVRAMAAAKRIDIDCSFRITTEQVDGGADRVQQIFWNLLINAVKFTPEDGHVWVTATCADHEICVAVRDDGIGISPDFLPQLFNRFSQEDTSTTRGHSGLGLGLFLVRYLLKLHGGRVTAESPGEGHGTTFSMYFPLRARSDKYLTVGPSEDGSGVPLPSLAGLQVLLIDDQEEARESLSMVLDSAGASVFAAGSSIEAVNWLEARTPDQLPDVLVCDIAMPGEDGYAVLRKIRAWHRDKGSPLQRLPALAVTAFAQREDRIRALTAGFQMHLTKPVAPEELIVVIDTMVGRG